MGVLFLCFFAAGYSAFRRWFVLTDAAALAEFIREKYGFISVDCKMILRGVGDTYLVKVTGGAETGSAGAVVGRVLAQGNGLDKRFILRVYRPDQRSLSKLNEKQLYNLGYQMARFHEASQTIELEDKRWTFDVETTLFKPLDVLRDVFAEDA